MKAIAGLVLLLTACVTPVRPLARVRVAMDQASISQADGTISIHVDLTIVNPNQHSVSLSALDWTLELDNRPVARGRLDFTRNIPARQPVTLRVSDHLGKGASARHGQRLLAKGATVRIGGVLHFVGDGAGTATNFDSVTSTYVAQ